MICKLCGCEKETRREMHGHLMRMHTDDYRRGGCNLERFCDNVPPLKKTTQSGTAKKYNKVFPRPEGFRILNAANTDEKYAIEMGFDFIDIEENLYTEQEARAEKWI